MLYQHTSIWQSSIKAFTLTILQDIILVLVSFVVNDICLPHVRERLHLCNCRVCVELYRLRPSAHHLLIARIAGRRIGITIVRAGAHQVPIAHAVVLSAICRIIHIGKSHTMRELMAESADTGQRSVRLQLRCAGISINGYVIQSQRTGLIIRKTIHVWPN